MNIFYNKAGIGDTLMIRINHEECEIKVETIGHIAKIMNAETNEVVGYNLFEASTYGDIDANGAVELTDEIKQIIHEAFTKNGLEPLNLEQKAQFVVGYVQSKEAHPNADKLSICKVDVGEEVLQIVCGAPNVDEGQLVVVALVGAVMPSGLVIKEAVLRGVESSGMICSAKELELPNAPEERGILVLDPSYEVGTVFKR